MKFKFMWKLFTTEPSLKKGSKYTLKGSSTQRSAGTFKGSGQYYL